jgi:hypothetical protein
MRLAAPILLLAAVTAAAQPPAIYRCGPDGRQLQQAPCGDGAKPALVAPEPTAAERAEAAAVAKRDAQHAERMKREREQRERLEAGSAAPAVGIAPPPKPASAPTTSTRKKPPKRATGVSRPT